MAKPNAVKPSTEVATQSGGFQLVTERPSFLMADDKRGNEGVGSDDLVIPRLEVAQALSPCVDRESPDYIDGCVPGMLFNTVSRACYEKVVVIPVLFKKQFLIWADRTKNKQAEGFFGAYESELEAKDAMELLQADPEAIAMTIQPTGVHYGLMGVPGALQLEQIAISMARTKIKVSKRWNSLVQMSGGARFSRAYLVSSVSETNTKGKFHNFNVALAGFPPEQFYKQAEELYNLLSSGVKVVTNHGEESTDVDSDM